MEANAYFYLGSPIPEYNPNRIKVGIAKSIGRRTIHHRCTSPGFTVRKSWPCLNSWERGALAVLRERFPKANWLGPEVLEVADWRTVRRVLDEYFESQPVLTLSALDDIDYE